MGKVDRPQISLRNLKLKMAYKIVVLPEAEIEIKQAFSYISEHAPEAAIRWYRCVREAIESISEMPARCPVTPESAKLNFEIRHLLYGKRPGIYRIVFRIAEEEQEVHILTVRHSTRKSLSQEDMQVFRELD